MFHCQNIRSVPLSELDPSLAFGFYCKDRADLCSLWAQLSSLSSEKFPVISVGTSKPDYTYDADDMDLSLDGLSCTSSPKAGASKAELRRERSALKSDAGGSALSDDGSDDDFVLL